MSILPEKVGSMECTIYPDKVAQVKPQKEPNPDATLMRNVFIGVAVFAGLIAIVYAVGVANFSSSFEGEWSRTEFGTSSYYKLILDVDDGHISYLFDSFYVDDEISNYEYTIVGPGQVMIDGRTYSVEINDDVMTITPALTSSDSSERWFK